MFLLAPIDTSAQNALYDHEIVESDGTYVPISGGTRIAGRCDDAQYRFNFSSIPGGFTFNYDNQDITYVYCGANGWITLNRSYSTWYPTYVNTTPMIIAFCADDMYVNTDITWKVDGSMGSRVLTIQYSDVFYY